MPNQPLKKILISGAGIAGPSLAYWLLKYGFEPTIVEHAPSFRVGGYMIDYWGVGYDAAEKMNLLDDLAKVAYTASEIYIVNDKNKRVSGFDAEVMRDQLKGRYISLLRSDLALCIYEKIKDLVPVLFGDTITGINDTSQGVEVKFEKNASAIYDIVIGADGLHSNLRHLAFGGHEQFERPLGFYAGAFSAAGYLPRDENIYVCYNIPGRQISRFALRDNRSVFFFVGRVDPELRLEHLSSREKQDFLKNEFSGGGWECDAILDAMSGSDDLYLDSVSQTVMPQWSKGRICLLGDAAYCPSLLAGQGAALAVAGAYVLAGELKSAPDDYSRAFGAYENYLRDFVEKKQKSALEFASWFAPKSKFDIFMRDQVTNLFNIPLVANKVIGSSVGDKLELKDY